MNLRRQRRRIEPTEIKSAIPQGRVKMRLFCLPLEKALERLFYKWVVR